MRVYKTTKNPLVYRQSYQSVWGNFGVYWGTIRKTALVWVVNWDITHERQRLDSRGFWIAYFRLPLNEHTKTESVYRAPMEPERQYMRQGPHYVQGQCTRRSIIHICTQFQVQIGTEWTESVGVEVQKVLQSYDQLWSDQDWPLVPSCISGDLNHKLA